MAYLNRVMLIGRLAANPYVKRVNALFSTARFSLAMSHAYRNQNGERCEKTEWINCVANNNSPSFEYASQLNKGDQVYLEGVLQTRSWMDKTTGRNNYITEVVIQKVYPLDRAPQNTSDKPVEQNDQQYDALDAADDLAMDDILFLASEDLLF